MYEIITRKGIGFNVQGTWTLQNQELFLRFEENNTEIIRELKIETLLSASLVVSYENGKIKIHYKAK